MNDKPQPPGWSLDQPFNFDDSAADLHAAIRRAADLARTDDGSAGHAQAMQHTQAAIEQIKARMRRHARP